MTRSDRLAEVQALTAKHGLTIRRAWPRDGNHLLLDLVPNSCGRPTAGQWFADDARAARAAASTGPPARADGGLVLQPQGADRRLPGLAPLLKERGSVLITHRPGRRAVVHRADGNFTKVVRPGSAQLVADAVRAAAVPGLRIPHVISVSDAAGHITTKALPGRTLHDLLGAGSELAVAAARSVGHALATLHAAPLRDGCRVHDGRAELAILHRWHEHAASFGLLPRGLVPEALRSALALPPTVLVPVHGDLHDKQVLVDDDESVGLVDFDLAAAGEPALDLANMMVHLQWRAEQGHTTPQLARRCVGALLGGYQPADAVRHRLDSYAAATRLRLKAVYCFRPGVGVSLDSSKEPSVAVRWLGSEYATRGH